MDYRLAYRRYHLEFRRPVRTSHGLWTHREGVIVRLTGSDGVVRYGEAAPIPWFGTETVDEVAEACAQLGEKVDDARLDAVPEELGCLVNALRVARTPAVDPANVAPRQIAALLPAGQAAMPLIEPLADAGFRIFKWKVGVGELTEELGLLDELCGRLPSGAKLRLDANGAWDRRTAQRWLERCAERPIEFVEQPCFAEPSAFAKAMADKSQGTTEQRKLEDLLLGLAQDFPTPLALDESVIRAAHVERWLDLGWPGFYVLKPSLLADPVAVTAKLAAAKAKVVFSSALETGVGAKAALRTAFASTGEPFALGFGVWPLFALPELNGPTATPFVRWADVSRINEEAVWNALN
uniref:o-succinylbenzoate synthase n=1 Tax=Cephaloticoccus sp. TaxID=1985742 RepID=UPI00404AC204